MVLEFLNLDLTEILAAVTIFIAYSIMGLSGFGSGLVAVPLLAFFSAHNSYRSGTRPAQLQRHRDSEFIIPKTGQLASDFPSDSIFFNRYLYRGMVVVDC